MKRSLTFLSIPILLIFCFTACVKDTDFEQGDDVSLTPVVELDLIYFNLVAEDFFDQATQNPILTVNDTTKIEFLNESGVRENLVKADFQFTFTNSIPRQFLAEFNFLNENNEQKYTITTNVESGSEDDPVITNFFETIEGADITRLTSSNKVVVSVTIPSSDINLEGTLNLKSKTTYFLEF